MSWVARRLLRSTPAEERRQSGVFASGKPVSMGRWELGRYAEVIEEERMPRRFGAHTSVIYLLAWLILGSAMDGGITQNAVTLASLLFWTCAAALLTRCRGRASGIGLLFLRWGLLAFVLFGTPVLRPVVRWWWEWLNLALLLCESIMFVMSLFYLVVRVFGGQSPFDKVGLESPCDDQPPRDG